MSRTQTPRERMVQSAALLMREQGVERTSFSRVVEHAGAPRGSIYHYFPGGKAQLIEEATRFGGAFVAAGLTDAVEQDDPLAALEMCATFWRTVLNERNFEAGCPIVAATLDGERTPAVRQAAAEVFQEWEDMLAGALRRKGVPPKRAQSLSTLVFASTEGAAIIARAQQSLAPVERVFGELAELLSEELRAAGAAT